MTPRLIVFSVSLILSLSCFSQRRIEGLYKNFGKKYIRLYTDSIFLWTDYYDIYGVWSWGKWTMKGDTVFFHPVQIHDTVRTYKKDGTYTDEIILSTDQIPERLSVLKTDKMGLGLSGQRMEWFPDKLFHKGRRLFEVKDGRLIRKKFGLKPGLKKLKPGFIRVRQTDEAL